MKQTMTSRQRVLAAIEHRPVDRVPIDLGCHYSTGISAFAYHRLREYLGLCVDHIDIIDPMQFLARVDDDILERFHCDCIHLSPGFANPVRYTPREGYTFTMEKELLPIPGEDGRWILRNGDQRAVMPAGGYFFDGDWINAFDCRDEAVLERLAAEARRIWEQTDYFTMFIGFGAFFSVDIEFMIKMVEDPDEIHRINGERLKSQLELARRVIDKMGGYIQAVTISSDLGTQNGPLVNPSLHRELCGPYIRQFCDFIHRESDLKVFMHSCGSIEPIIGTLADAGVDVLNPVQISAAHMEPEALKAKYGDRIAFWGGGCDTQRVLATATPREVRENVRHLTGVFSRNSGFIFNQVHNIMGDVPPENIVAMLEEAYAAGAGRSE